MSTLAGTPVYMAPEVLKNQPYSVQSDIFSLGHLCYELCELRRLFNPLTWTTLERDHSQPYPRVDGDQYSEALCDLIAQMLSHEPEHRPTSAQVRCHPSPNPNPGKRV
jgi:serine/threonine protein kinase